MASLYSLFVVFCVIFCLIFVFLASILDFLLNFFSFCNFGRGERHGAIALGRKICQSDSRMILSYFWDVSRWFWGSKSSFRSIFSQYFISNSQKVGWKSQKTNFDRKFHRIKVEISHFMPLPGEKIKNFTQNVFAKVIFQQFLEVCAPTFWSAFHQSSSTYFWPIFHF